MRPHTPQDRRGFESADWTPPGPDNDRTRIEDRTRRAGTVTLLALLALVVIVALVFLL